MRPYLLQLPDWLPILGGQPLYSYGIMLGISFVVGWLLCVELCRRERMNISAVSSILVTVVVSAILGARILHFFTAPNVQLTFAEFFRFSDGGMVAYGGMAAAVVTSYLYAKYVRVNWWAFGDNAIPSLALGLGITRIGCFLFGCDYGHVSTSYFTFRYPRWDLPGVIERLAPAYTAHHGHQVDPFSGTTVLHSFAVYPTQLLESLVGFVLFAVLLLRKPFARFPGELILLFFGTYGVARFSLELVRGDVDRGTDVWGTGLTPSQIFSVAAVFWVINEYKRRLAAHGTAVT